jgi:AcrR family transcriptional regulator
MSRSAVPRPRDRAATEQRIVDAAIGILSDDGFVALGINPLADRAGVDKQLIYRYFGGLDGVVAALGAGSIYGWETSLQKGRRPRQATPS